VIVRAWRGWAASHEAADAYRRHLAEDVFPRLRTISGHVDARLLRRSKGDGIELLVLTTWESLDAVRAFAGDTPERAVVEPEARAVLAAFDEHVDHYELVLAS
jgi:heme-degrading monooxygenase HmoA